MFYLILYALKNIYNFGFFYADVIKPEDVGVSPDIPCFRKNPKKAFQRVTYFRIFECGKFSVFRLNFNCFHDVSRKF